MCEPYSKLSYVDVVDQHQQVIYKSPGVHPRPLAKSTNQPTQQETVTEAVSHVAKNHIRVVSQPAFQMTDRLS